MESGDQVASRLLVELGTEFLVALILIVPIWRIFSRAGFSGFWSLLMFIPFAGYLIATLMLAFRRWPNSTEVVEVE